jgi:hypothetical protein
MAISSGMSVADSNGKVALASEAEFANEHRPAFAVFLTTTKGVVHR